MSLYVGLVALSSSGRLTVQRDRGLEILGVLRELSYATRTTEKAMAESSLVKVRYLNEQRGRMEALLRIRFI